MQQGSTESLNDVPLSDKPLESTRGPSDIVNELEGRLKVLMQTTGATSPSDLLERFTAQKEAMQRLNYLRTVTESEKKHLEQQRDGLSSQLEQLKFSDTKENEVYVSTDAITVPFLVRKTGEKVLKMFFFSLQKSRILGRIENKHCRKESQRE